ncbi:MAG: hypothetical protein RI573_06125 [Balneolaceae bacterium]|nr:hypothetical protein [Balneolaceae bacterium]
MIIILPIRRLNRLIEKIAPQIHHPNIVKRMNFYIFFLWFLIVYITIDAIYIYLTDGILELFYIGSVYAAAGIGLEALKKLKNRSLPAVKSE